jgi:hypothetical protein
MVCCSGNIRVYCRVRPFLTDEPGRPTTVQYIGENGELVLGNPSKSGGKEPRRTFTFNKVFATTASQGRFSYFLLQACVASGHHILQSNLLKCLVQCFHS